MSIDILRVNIKTIENRIENLYNSIYELNRSLELAEDTLKQKKKKLLKLLGDDVV